MSLVEDTLEWRSILDALRNLSVAAVRSTLGNQAVVAYTDGACIKNPGGPAGWSTILLAVGNMRGGIAAADAARLECYGHIPRSETTTNNRAEITAVLATLCIALPDVPLIVTSDSEYTIKVAQGTYQMKANSDLWAMYRMLAKRRTSSIDFEWVRGHTGHDLNERADELAGLGAWNGDPIAYRQWQDSSALEAHNRVSPSELAVLRQQVQKLKILLDSIPTENPRVSEQERKFIDDMAKRLQKNNFSPSPKQSNWVKALVGKYKV